MKVDFVIVYSGIPDLENRGFDWCVFELKWKDWGIFSLYVCCSCDFNKGIAFKDELNRNYTWIVKYW